jgi:hypothetical protein
VTGDGINDCLFHQPDGSALQVDVYANDPDLKYYKTLSLPGDHQISGIGDQAYWNEALPGQTPPELIAHKGNVTCVMQSNDPPDTTLKIVQNTSTGLYTVSDADALGYVQLMGKVCNDVFATR